MSAEVSRSHYLLCWPQQQHLQWITYIAPHSETPTFIRTYDDHSSLNSTAGSVAGLHYSHSVQWFGVPCLCTSLLSHRSKMIGTGTSPSSSCRHYLCLLGSFSVVLVCGALTFSHLERGPEVQIRFELSERKQEFAKKFKVNGDSPTFYSYCKASK